MTSNYKVLAAIRDYPNETDLQIAKMCATKVQVVRRLRYKSKPKFKPVAGTYFIADQRGRVKIGVSKNVIGRLHAIQTDNADKLTLLKVVGEDEIDLHTKFDKYRIRGEWFTLSDEIREYLK